MLILTGIGMDQFQWNIWAVIVLPIYGTVVWPDFDTPEHSCRTALSSTKNEQKPNYRN